MALPISIPVVLRPSYAGLTLTAQLFDPLDGSPLGSPISSGFVDRGTGVYIWSGVIPDVVAATAFGVAFLDGSTELAATAINPAEYADIIDIRAWIATLTQPVVLTQYSGVGVTGDVTIYRGDSYTTGSKYGPLVWPGTSVAWGDFVGKPAVFTAKRGRVVISETAIFEDMGGGVVRARVELPSDDTEPVPDSMTGRAAAFPFDIQVTTDLDVNVSPIYGSFTVIKDVSPPGD